jgi:tetratricopeptide (TPR) repeat protein
VVLWSIGDAARRPTPSGTLLATHATSVFESPPAAYRDDAAARGSPFGKHDGLWITVATIVHHAAIADAPRKPALLRDAIELTQEIVDDDVLNSVGQREWGARDRCSCEPIMLLAKLMADAGAFRLAGGLLDALLRADASLNAVQRGRILAKRARISWLAGEIDDAQARYAFVETLGRRARSAELKVRAWNGFVALAQMRGNYPEVQRYARRAARLADRDDMRALSRTAHYGLLVAAAVERRFDDALIEGWKVYELSSGDSIDEAGALQNLGQVLLDSGHAAVGEIAFSAVCARPLPARILLPALGGLAIASAAADHEPTMEWAVREIRGMRRSAAPRYAVTSALLECAVALAIVGRETEASSCATESLALAKRYGFHEIEIRAETLLQRKEKHERSGDPARLRPRTASVVRRISSLEPSRLPKHVRPTAVTV